MRVSNEQLREAVEQAQEAHPQGFHQYMWTDNQNHAEGPCAYDLALDLVNDRDKLARLDGLLWQARDLIADSNQRIIDTSRSDRDHLAQIVLALAQNEPIQGDTCALCWESSDGQARIVHQYNCPWVRAHTWAMENDDDFSV